MFVLQAPGRSCCTICVIMYSFIQQISVSGSLALPPKSKMCSTDLCSECPNLSLWCDGEGCGTCRRWSPAERCTHPCFRPGGLLPASLLCRQLLQPLPFADTELLFPPPPPQQTETSETRSQMKFLFKLFLSDILVTMTKCN